MIQKDTFAYYFLLKEARYDQNVNLERISESLFQVIKIFKDK